jgi:hypothetical protein
MYTVLVVVSNGMFECTHTSVGKNCTVTYDTTTKIPI